MSGIFLINKPAGITSHDVVDVLRKVTREKRIGHAGTLDPIAKGLMIVAIGREFTKQLDKFIKLDKTYLAQATLGQMSTTYDSEGELAHVSLDVPSATAVKQAIAGLKGRQMQTPPAFSAKKLKGQRAYRLARQGSEVKLEPNEIEVYNSKLVHYDYPVVEFEVHVSSGTYVRTLIHELGQTLGTGAFMSGLTRTAIGEMKLDRAVALGDIQDTEDIIKGGVDIG
ncbi:MAG: tRNA pseudouridine(55) synthase TruB [Patescibacteria group bacterium]|nr:tRNA pseudouridine(55) synthase TruB [Patescibacteria group bacterium]